MAKFVFIRIENIEGKGENAGRIQSIRRQHFECSYNGKICVY